MDETRPLTRRERELAERPFCVKCGVTVVRTSSELINGQLWCLRCHHWQPRRKDVTGKGATNKSPRPVRRHTSRSRKVKRRRLWQSHPFCVYCGCALTLEVATLDHVVPLSKGGTNSADNLVLACQSCNRKKADGLPTQPR
jgi:5-methylcytosine-specific restriction endonuclease McrA